MKKMKTIQRIEEFINEQSLSYLSKFSTTESKLRRNLNSYCEKFF